MGTQNRKFELDPNRKYDILSQSKLEGDSESGTLGSLLCHISLELRRPSDNRCDRCHKRNKVDLNIMFYISS